MITLYTAPTGNGHRVSIMLEELGLSYDVVKIDFTTGGHLLPDFLAINPVGQIPAITDTDGPGGQSINLAESSAILRYLARKCGKFAPTDPLEQMEADRWTAIIAGGLQDALTTIFFAKMLDEESHVKIIGRQHEIITRYLGAMDARLSSVPWLAGSEYCYVDMLGFTIANRTLGVLGIDLVPYPAIQAWCARIAERPAVVRGLSVPA